MANNGDDILSVIETGIILKLIEEEVCGLERAAEVVGSYIDEARDSYGGVRYMFRRGYRRFSPKVVRTIRNEYNGRNMKKLCKKYGMSRTTFYSRVLK